MNLDVILNTLDFTGQAGRTLTTEESTVLYNSLLILQNENHFSKIYFWGKIFGAEKDYYISYGFVKDVLNARTFYYSRDCVNWGLLPLPTENGKLLTPLCTTIFQGDPALVIDVLIEKGETVKDVTIETPQIRRLKEEDRLSATVYYLNHEAVLIPRGALFKRPDGVVVENRTFDGLTELESREIKSFLHYRPPTQMWNTNLLTRDDFTLAIDFLDSCDTDIPEGCYMHHLVAGDTLVVIKPMYWPGMLFFHYLNTPRYGFVYFGHGKKCLDVPFLLLPNL
ncbi:radial spoke head protein 9 homolog [Aethina tumida]|uniref:radial spoke head protein 9 homolog n=1 Tax=Aethina tumida TaxID=116153 RepID=UPI002148C8F5|nr:radial spoke head protein 9 homolog [Aethina tumida]